MGEAGGADQASSAWARRARSVAAVAGVGGAYFVLACFVYWPISPLDGRHIVGAVAGDPVQEAWFLRWPSYALTHGANPMFTHYLNVPAGANLGLNTSMPLLGLLGWPVMAVSNSVAAYNLLLRLALALSALSMYLVLRRYVRWSPAALLGGLWFGFSPYMIGQARVHLFLVFLPLIPPIVLIVDDWLIHPRRSPLRSGVLLGVVTGLEFLISAEVVALMAIFVSAAVVALAIRRSHDVRPRLPLLGRGVIVAAAVTISICGYPLWMLLFGPERPNTPPHAPVNLDAYHGDLVSLVLPSRLQLIRGPLFTTTGEHLVRGSLTENGFYLGLPLLFFLLLMAAWRRNSGWTWALAAIAVVSFLLGLGTTLTVGGVSTHISLPLSAVTRAPLLQELEPARFSLGLQLAAAVGFALALDRFRGWLGRHLHGVTPHVRPAVAALVVVATIIPAAPDLPIRSVPFAPPPYFRSGQVKAVHPGATALTYPYASYASSAPMIWQIASDFRFKIFGGEVYVRKPNGHSANFNLAALPPDLQAVLVVQRPWQPPSAPTSAQLAGALRQFCLRYHVDVAFVRPASQQGKWVAQLFTDTFQRPPDSAGGIDTWLDVPSLLHARQTPSPRSTPSPQ